MAHQVTWRGAARCAELGANRTCLPMSEMTRYTTQLRSITGGRGYFSMELDHYDTVPAHVAGPIIDAHRKEMEAKKEE